MKLSNVWVFFFFVWSVSFAVGAEAAWRPLFNGKDLSGWEVFLGVPFASSQIPGAERDATGNYVKPLGVNNDPTHIVSVVDVDGRPAIHLGPQAPGGVATLESFSNYHMRFQFKWGERTKDQRPGQARNAGLLYYAFGQRGDVQGKWMHSLQFQIKEGFTGDLVVMGDALADLRANKIDAKRVGYDPAAEIVTFGNKLPLTPYCTKTGKDYEKPVSEWNTLEIYAVGDSAVQIVNGQVALRLTGSRKIVGDGFAALKGGRIELQMEGWDIFFRDIEIKSVTEIPAEYAAP